MNNLKSKIGIISDTHGVLPDGCAEIFQGCQAILHAGDIGEIGILDQLGAIAPVTAVRGNMDFGRAFQHLSRREMVQVGGVSFYLIHEPFLLDIDPGQAGVDCVVFGHTHMPTAEKRDDLWFINPGSASRPKQGMAPTVDRYGWQIEYHARDHLLVTGGY